MRSWRHEQVQHVEDLEREVEELRQANEILQRASALFCPAGARPPAQVLSDFIDKHRDTHGVEPICKVLQTAPSGYRRRRTVVLPPFAAH